MTEMPAVNASTGRSIATDVRAARSSGAIATSRSTPQYAMTSPATAPAALRSRLSVRSWRTRRPRDAPRLDADGHFAIARRGTRQQQSRDVRACDQQHDDHRSQKHGNEPRRLLPTMASCSGFEVHPARCCPADMPFRDARRCRSSRSAPPRWKCRPSGGRPRRRCAARSCSSPRVLDSVVHASGS